MYQVKQNTPNNICVNLRTCLGHLMYLLLSVLLQIASHIFFISWASSFSIRLLLYVSTWSIGFVWLKCLEYYIKIFRPLSGLMETSFGHLKSKVVLSCGTRSVAWLLYYSWLDKVSNLQMYGSLFSLQISFLIS